MKVIIKCVNIKLLDILGCFHYILNASPRYKKTPCNLSNFKKKLIPHVVLQLARAGQREVTIIFSKEMVITG